MARTRDAHPLGKCAEERLEIGLPGQLKERLGVIATIHGKTPTFWARDALEKAIEGEWIFIQRRVITPRASQQHEEPPGESTDA